MCHQNQRSFPESYISSSVCNTQELTAAYRSAAVSSNGLKLIHHGIKSSVLLKSKDERTGNDRTHNGRNEEGDDICGKTNACGRDAHECHGNRIGQQAADNAGAKNFADQRRQKFLAVLPDKAAEQRAAHTARKRQQTAEAKKITDQRSKETCTEGIPRTKKHSCHHINKMLEEKFQEVK